MLGVDRLDDYGAPHSPNEVQVGRMDHHAILVGRVEANRGANAQMGRWRHNLLLPLIRLLRWLHHLISFLFKPFYLF